MIVVPPYMIGYNNGFLVLIMFFRYLGDSTTSAEISWLLLDYQGSTMADHREISPKSLRYWKEYFHVVSL